jgi:hypothetical protein
MRRKNKLSSPVTKAILLLKIRFRKAYKGSKKKPLKNICRMLNFDPFMSIYRCNSLHVYV